MPDSPVIEVKDLRKSYSQTEALRGLTLGVSSGSIHAFLGRNGAGKTTAIKILLGMTRADSGEARVLGLAINNAKDSVSIRGRTGFVSEEKDLYDDMTVQEIIRFTRAFYPRCRRALSPKPAVKPCVRARTTRRNRRSDLRAWSAPAPLAVRSPCFPACVPNIFCERRVRSTPCRSTWWP